MNLARVADASRTNNNFDLLRLGAALLVIFAHSFDLLRLAEPFPRIADLSWGFVGVLVFFSISGFLVARSWARDPRLIAFVVKRALRLLPALVVVLLLSAVVLGPLVTSLPLHVYLYEPGTKAYVLNNATMQSDYDLPGVFAQNAYPFAVNGSLWTLPLEVKAYAFIAIIGAVGLLWRRRLVMILVVPLVVMTCVDSWRAFLPGANHFVAALVDIQTNHSLVYQASVGTYNVYAQMFAAFAVGSGLYALRKWVPLRWELAVGAVAVWLATVWVVGGEAPATAAVVLGPYVVLCLAYGTTRFMRLPRLFGDYSYGIYVYAFPIQQTISSLTHLDNGWIMFAVSVPPTALAAVASWHLVERPALRLKYRLAEAEPPAGAVTQLGHLDGLQSTDENMVPV